MRIIVRALALILLLPALACGAGIHALPAGQLPAKARQTLRLVDEGGPFPYPEDGATFGNHEGMLPAEPAGYYHEYTVPTPGSRDRGVRRIIAGKNGERYYTGDHYQTFERVTY
jgi:ribonuclease T1